MKRYDVCVEVRLVRHIEVEANNEEEAYHLVNNLVVSENVVLNDNDWADTNIYVNEEIK